MFDPAAFNPTDSQVQAALHASLARTAGRELAQAALTVPIAPFKPLPSPSPPAPPAAPALPPFHSMPPASTAPHISGRGKLQWDYTEKYEEAVRGSDLLESQNGALGRKKRIIYSPVAAERLLWWRQQAQNTENTQEPWI